MVWLPEMLAYGMVGLSDSTRSLAILPVTYVVTEQWALLLIGYDRLDTVQREGSVVHRVYSSAVTVA